MSKIVLTADIHLDYKDRLGDTINSLRAVSRYMTANEIEYAMIMGDLFNDRTAVSTDAMNAAYEFFKEVKELGQIWAAFPGNHDMFFKYSWEVHSMKSLSEVLNVYDRECLIQILGQRFWILPYIHDEEIFMKAVNAIKDKAEPDDILLTHVGVNGATLNECFLHKNWSFVSFEDFPHRVYSGHFHCHQQVGDNMWYPGSLIPFRFDEGLVDHGFLVYDVDKKDHEFVKTFDQFTKQPEVQFGVQDTSRLDDGWVVPPPPDFITILDNSLDTLTSEEVHGNNIRVSLSRDYTNDERIEIRENLEKLGAISISWTKAVETIVPINEETIAGTELSLNKPDTLLNAWLDLDKPDHIDRDLILKLNAEVTEKNAS